MLKLTYNRQNDPFQTVTVLGDPIGIRDLYWQLTHNYSAQDGTAIKDITITNLDGIDCTQTIMTEPYSWATTLNNLNK